MGGLTDRLPTHAWIAVLSLGTIAVFAFFVPPSVGAAVGLTLHQYILVVGILELMAALGIASIVVHYHDFDREPRKWQYDP